MGGVLSDSEARKKSLLPIICLQTCKYMYMNNAAGTKVSIILHQVFTLGFFPSGKEWHNCHDFGNDIGSMGVFIVQEYTQPSG